MGGAGADESGSFQGGGQGGERAEVERAQLQVRPTDGIMGVHVLDGGRSLEVYRHVPGDRRSSALTEFVLGLMRSAFVLDGGRWDERDPADYESPLPEDEQSEARKNDTEVVGWMRGMCLHSPDKYEDDFSEFFSAVLRDRGRIVAVAVLRVLGALESRALEVQLVAVPVSCEGRGYGKTMVGLVDDLGAALGADHILVSAAAQKISMWTHLGFSVTDKKATPRAQQMFNSRGSTAMMRKVDASQSKRRVFAPGGSASQGLEVLSALHGGPCSPLPPPDWREQLGEALVARLGPHEAPRLWDARHNVAFLGTDGSGKSKLVDALMRLPHAAEAAQREEAAGQSQHSGEEEEERVMGADLVEGDGADPNLTFFEESFEDAGGVVTSGNVKEVVEEPEEVALNRTLYNHVYSRRYGARKVQLVDTPGHRDFLNHVLLALKVTDGVVLAMSPRDDRNANEERFSEQQHSPEDIAHHMEAWHPMASVCRGHPWLVDAAVSSQKPLAIFVNKLDTVAPAEEAGVGLSPAFKELEDLVKDVEVATQRPVLLVTAPVFDILGEIERVVDVFSDLDEVLPSGSPLDVKPSDAYATGHEIPEDTVQHASVDAELEAEACYAVQRMRQRDWIQEQQVRVWTVLAEVSLETIFQDGEDENEEGIEDAGERREQGGLVGEEEACLELVEAYMGLSNDLDAAAFCAAMSGAVRAESVRRVFTAAIRQARIVPMLCGSARLKVGVSALSTLIEEMCTYAIQGASWAIAGRAHSEPPAPALGTPFSAFVFKASWDEVEKRETYYALVRSGKLVMRRKGGAEVLNGTTGNKITVGGIAACRTPREVDREGDPSGQYHHHRADASAEEISVAVAGDIIRIRDVKGALAVNQTLCDVSSAINYAPVILPSPPLAFLLDADSRGDIVEELSWMTSTTDPSMTVERQVRGAEEAVEGEEREGLKKSKSHKVKRAVRTDPRDPKGGADHEEVIVRAHGPLHAEVLVGRLKAQGLTHQENLGTPVLESS